MKHVGLVTPYRLWVCAVIVASILVGNRLDVKYNPTMWEQIVINVLSGTVLLVIGFVVGFFFNRIRAAWKRNRARRRIRAKPIKAGKPNAATAEIIYDLNNGSDMAFWQEFQKYRQVADEYFQGKMSTDNALAFLSRGIRNYKDRRAEIPTGKVPFSQICQIAFYGIRISQIQKLIDEIEEHAAR